jgi:DNA-binding transcriptional regulator/RsmH inhibitor MraZ
MAADKATVPCTAVREQSWDSAGRVAIPDELVKEN